jgi:hypothetical protein
MNRSSFLSRLFATSARWRRVALWSALLSVSAGADSLAQAPMQQDMPQQVAPEQVFAEQAPPNAFVMAPDASGSVADRASWRDDVGVGGMGVQARLGHIAGQTVGRTNSISTFEAMPYVFADETMFYLDGRFYTTNYGDIGGTGGGGIRHFLPNYNSVLGGGVFYDADATRGGTTFQQYSFAIEYLSEWLDVRTNYYHRTGRRSAELGTTFVDGSQHFEDTSILFNTKTKTAAGTSGLDMTFTVPVPGYLPQRANMEASAGWYHYQASGLKLPQVWGWRLRLDADWFSNIAHTFLDFTSDKVFNENIVFGVDLNYYGDQQRRPRVGHNQYNRMTEWVRRNYTVVAIEKQIVNPDQFAINPATGLPYVVLHVRNDVPPNPQFPNFPAPTGNGSVDTPYQFISEAQADPKNADIIFVHSGSVFTNMPVVLEQNQQILGEGVIHPIAVANVPFARARPFDPLGTIPLPTATGGKVLPILQNTLGDAVTLADGGTFAGFDINTTTGNGIVANGVNGSTVRDVTISGVTAGNGLNFTNNTGTFRIENLNISGVTDDTVVFDGGASTVNWFGGTINSTVGHSVLIQNQTGGVINLAGDNGTNPVNTFGGVTITENGGTGILIQDTAAQVSFGRAISTAPGIAGVTINDSTAAGVRITDLKSTGSVNFLRGLAINNAAGVSLDIDAVAGDFALIDDTTLVDDLTITNRNSTGINLNDIQSQSAIVFFGNTNIGGVADVVNGGTTDPAINFHGGSLGLVRFEGDITIGSGGGLSANNEAISIGVGAGPVNFLPNAVGARFTANGDVNILQGGTGPSIIVSGDPTNVQFGTTLAPAQISITPGLGSAIQLLNNTGSIAFNSSVNVGTSIATAIDVEGNTGTVAFGSVNVSDALGPAPAVFVEGNTTVGFGNLNVVSTGALAVDAENNDSLSVGGGTIDADGAAAIRMIDNDTLSATFLSVTATNYDGTVFPWGIEVANTTLNAATKFVVTGNNARGTGGLISSGVGSAAGGTHIQNINTVSILGQDYIDNDLRGMFLQDVPTFTMISSRFTNNGAADTLGLRNQFLAEMSILRNGTANNPGSYNYLIGANEFLDSQTVVGNDAMVQVRGLNSARGSNLTIDLGHGRDDPQAGVDFNASRSGTNTAAVRINWNGNLDATMSRARFILNDGSNNAAGFDIHQSGTGFLNNIVYDGNLLTGTSAASNGNEGVRFDLDGRTTLSITNTFDVDPGGNVIPGMNISGTNAVGFDLSMRTAGNNVFIDRNWVRISTDGGTGLLFNTINTSNVTIADSSTPIPNTDFVLGNQFDLFDGGVGSATERGIIFQTTFGTINLSGSGDNVINQLGAAQGGIIFFQPPASSTGQISINGVLQP